MKLADQLIQARTESIALRARIAELEAAKDADWRKFVVMTHDERIMAMYRLWRDAVDWASLWKQAAKKWYSYALFWQGKKTDELAQALERVRELEDENDQLGTAGMRERDRAEELEAENARLRQKEGVLALWKRQAEEADKHPGGSLMALIYRAHASLVREALQAGAEAGGEGEAE